MTTRKTVHFAYPAKFHNSLRAILKYSLFDDLARGSALIAYASAPPHRGLQAQQVRPPERSRERGERCKDIPPQGICQTRLRKLRQEILCLVHGAGRVRLQLPGRPPAVPLFRFAQGLLDSATLLLLLCQPTRKYPFRRVSHTTRHSTYYSNN